MRNCCKCSFRNPLGRIIKAFGEICFNTLFAATPTSYRCLSSRSFSLATFLVRLPRGWFCAAAFHPSLPALGTWRERWVRAFVPELLINRRGWRGAPGYCGDWRHRAPLVNAIFDRSHRSGGIFTAPREDKTPGAGM